MTLDYFYGQAGELFSFYRIPKALFQEPRFQSLSTDAKTLYGILLDRMSLSAKNGWLDEQGRVFIIFTIEDVKRALCCADNKATKLLRELEEFGLIERKRRGLGKPSLVYVKNFSAESSKSIFQNRDFHDSGGFKSASQDPAKPRCNKTEENNTEMSETYPFYSEEEDGMSKREQLEEYFSQSLEVDTLLRLCPDDEDTIYQIVDLLVDTCATNRKMLRIAGDDKPAEVVRSRFMKLNADHIQFVLKCLAENSSPIRNMKQYLLASLYNAPTTMQLVYPGLSDGEVIDELIKASIYGFEHGPEVVTISAAEGIHYVPYDAAMQKKSPYWEGTYKACNIPFTDFQIRYQPEQVRIVDGKRILEDTAFLCRKDNDHFLILPSIYEKLDLDDWLLAHLFFYDKDGKRCIGVELSEDD